MDINDITTNADVQTSTPEWWSRDTLRHSLVQGVWPRFLTAGFVKRHTELQGKPGDEIHVQITSPLAGDGVEGDETQLEGNEESLSTSEIRLNTTMYRNAVRTYRRANKRSIIDLQTEARDRLGEWGADKMDRKRWSQFVSSDQADVPDSTYTPNVYVIGGGTDEGDITTGSTLSVAAMRLIRYKLLDQLAVPVMVNGLPTFILLISPEMEFDLKNDEDYDNYAVNAASRGMDNPVFTGAIAMVDGIVAITHQSVPSASDGGSGGTLRYSRAIAFGKEAFVEALDEDTKWVEKTFDYDNQLGVAYGFAFGARRGLEKNSLQVIASAAVPSD